MAIMLRKTWAPKGKTPFVYQRMNSHKKVSVIVSLCIAPSRDTLHLCFRLHSDENDNSQIVRSFRLQLTKQLSAPTVLIWHKLKSHRSRIVQNHIDHRADLTDCFLPLLYAPELIPVENVRIYMKMNSLSDLYVCTVDNLTKSTKRVGRSIQRKQKLLSSFMKHSPLRMHLN